jgi:hypothetical protein
VVHSFDGRFKGVIDQTVSTGQEVDRLIASNAIEHAAYMDIGD